MVSLFLLPREEGTELLASSHHIYVFLSKPAILEYEFLSCSDLESIMYTKLQPDSESQLLTIQFEWNGVLKAVSSTLVGVSPEFEIALYTLCFFMGGEDNHIELGPYQVNIKCYRFGDRIGSVFPTAEC